MGIFISNKFRFFGFLIIIFISTFLGILYWKLSSDKWYSKYDIEKPLDIVFLSNNYDSTIEKYNIDNVPSLIKILDDALLNFRTSNLEDKTPELYEIRVSNKSISFFTENIKNVENNIENLILEINKVIKKILIENILQVENFTINQIEKQNYFYERSKLFELELLRSEKYSDSLTGNTENRGGWENIKVLEDETSILNDLLSILIILNSKNKDQQLEFIIDNSENIKKLKIDVIKREFAETINAINNGSLIKIKYLDKKYNKKPSFVVSILGFSIIGFLVGFMFILLTSKSLINQVKKTSSFLQNQE